jgi:hypothetical protein
MAQATGGAMNESQNNTGSVTQGGKKIGWDWPLVKISRGPFKGRLYARSPSGELVRVTDADINGHVLAFIRKFGFSR